MSKIVYRIQNDKGIGPYCAISQDMWVDRSITGSPNVHGWHNGRPMPQEEGFDMDEYHLCCFDTLDKLFKWFSPTEILSLVIDFGFKVYKVTVFEIEAILEKQAIIDERCIKYKEVIEMDQYI